MFDVTLQKVYGTSEDAPIMDDDDDDIDFSISGGDDDDQLTFEFIDIMGNNKPESSNTGKAQGGMLAAGIPGFGGSSAGTENAVGSASEGSTAAVGTADGSDTNGSTDEAGATELTTFHTNKMAVIQTKDGMFLRFRLSEVPEQKKSARGVRGIKLNADDEVEKVYVVGFGEGRSVEHHGKKIELMKIKLARRGGKGTKIRG